MMTYKEYTQYKNSPKHIQKMFDNFYNKMHNLKYSPVYCQILSDVMYKMNLKELKQLKTIKAIRHDKNFVSTDKF